MKRYRTRIATATFALVVAFSQNSKAEPLSKMAISGAGASKCSQFTNNISNQAMREMTYMWVFGYMSGINSVKMLADQPTYNLNSVDSDEQEKHIIRYCKQFPDKPVFSAALDLYLRMGK